MAIITATLRVDNVTPQPHQVPVAPGQIQLHWGETQPPANFGFLAFQTRQRRLSDSRVDTQQYHSSYDPNDYPSHNHSPRENVLRVIFHRPAGTGTPAEWWVVYV